MLPAEGLGPLPSALAVAGVDLSSVSVVDLRALARRPGSIEPEATCVAVAVPVGRRRTGDRGDRDGDPRRPRRRRARRGHGQHGHHAVAGAGRIRRAIAARTLRDRRGGPQRERFGRGRRRRPPPPGGGAGRRAGGSRRAHARDLRGASARHGHVAKGGLRGRPRAGPLEAVGRLAPGALDNDRAAARAAYEPAAPGGVMRLAPRLARAGAS